MRPSVCLIVSILLVVVATIPQGRPGGDPRAWTTYKIPLPHPSFAPPDLGPLYLPQDYFDDYPDIKTSPQKQPVRQRNLLYHNRHQNEIANRWRETGEPPTEQEVLNRRQEIREMIRKAMIVEQEKIRDPVGFVPPQLRRVRNRRFETMKQIEVQIQDKTRAIKTLRQAHLEPDDRRLLGECQQKLEDSETIMVVCARIEEKIRAQIKKLSVQQQPFEMVSKQYKQIAHEMQQRETKLTKVRDQQEQTKRAATNARKCIRKCKERITGRPRMIARMEAELRKLRDELETLKGRSS
ncbi:MAG: hypothetical protein M1816_002156 [Peltula sp. TS41687]|nr:MAG: hypothetical protein M1816_002156 [Peltula sp. TS41687]